MDKLQLSDLDVAGRRVFVRVDFNVPLQNGVISDDTRIRASLETLRYLRQKGARIICASHLGRPKGIRSEDLSLCPLAARLSELLEAPVAFAEDCVGDEVVGLTERLQNGETLLLDNLRFHPGEKNNDPEFARELGRLADLYVNDAFGSSHRAHASIEGITHHVPRAAAGLLMEREIRGLGRAVNDPAWPFLLIVGGAKVRDKIAVVEGVLDKLDYLLIGGAMALTFLKARGMAVGRSRVEDDRLDVARRVLEMAEAANVEVALPSDQIAATALDSHAKPQVVESASFPDDLMGLDIGPMSTLRYREIIAEARTIVWNGPMGVFEDPRYAEGTVEIARAVAKSTAYSVVGGGDSVAAIKQAGVEGDISHVSTGGGASLEFLAGRVLPGIDALSAAP